MIRSKFRVLGLAFIAVLAMSAIGATAAQAAPLYTCSAYPCTGTGTSLENSEEFTTPGGTVTCHASYVVEKLGSNVGIPAPEQKVTVTPNYTGCKAFGFVNATVTTNGCDYDFTATQRIGVGIYQNHVGITCPAGKSIVIVAGTCEVDVGEAGNTNLTTVKTTNVGGKVTVEPEIGNEITMNVTKDGFGCPFTGTGHFKGSYHGHVVIHNAAGGASTISVSGE